MLKLTKLQKILCTIAGCLFALFGLGWLGMHLLIGDMCSNEIICQTLSPDKDLKAILFTRGCGASTATSYQVSVLNPWDSFSNADTGNVFVSYASPSLQWKDNRTLLITRTSAEAEKIFQEKREITVWPLFKSVKIEYADQGRNSAKISTGKLFSRATK
jgi:hypothetical protein